MEKRMLMMLALLVLLAGCGMKERAGIEQDEELFVGDLGVERLVSPRPLRHLEADGEKGEVLLDPNGFPLIRQFPNPKVKPLEGSYVENVIAEAKKYLGTPYEYGSDRTEPSTFDCSDYIRWAFLSAVGVDLPWDSRAQAAYVRAFADRQYEELSKAKRGDVLFFTRYLGDDAEDYEGYNVKEMPISHVAIYLGNNKIIHSPSKKSGGVRMDHISWRGLDHRFVFGGGILDSETKKKKSP